MRAVDVDVVEVVLADIPLQHHMEVDYNALVWQTRVVVLLLKKDDQRVYPNYQASHSSTSQGKPIPGYWREEFVIVSVCHDKEGPEPKDRIRFASLFTFRTTSHGLWIMAERTRYHIQAANMSFLCMVVGCSLRDRVRNSAIWAAWESHCSTSRGASWGGSGFCIGWALDSSLRRSPWVGPRTIKKLPWRLKSGWPCSDCCPHDLVLDNRGKMVGYHCLLLSSPAVVENSTYPATPLLHTSH